MKRILAVLLLLASCSAIAGELGGTLEVGETGFAVMRPVLAAASPHGCPRGELEVFVQEAMEPLGHEVILCRNCNRAYGPGLVSKHAYPPQLDRQNIVVGRPFGSMPRSTSASRPPTVLGPRTRGRTEGRSPISG